MVQLSATRCSFIAIGWVSVVSFVTITLYISSQRVFNVVSMYFIIDSVRKFLDMLSYLFFAVLFTEIMKLFLYYDYLRISTTHVCCINNSSAEFRGFHGGVISSQGLLDCDATLCCGTIPVVPLHSGPITMPFFSPIPATSP